MDVMRKQGPWTWFVASARWNVAVRGVLYSQGKVLVPLMADEVPFPYEHMGDVVFLWDPATGVALASARSSALVVSAPVPAGDSAKALYGVLSEDEGYCYRLVTGEVLDLGPYPSVDQLRRSGVKDVPGVSYHQQGRTELYHCRADGSGCAFSTLSAGTVVGADVTMAGFVLVGLTAASYLSFKGVEWLFDKLCVMGAAPVDLSVEVNFGRADGTLERPVVWFAACELRPGVVINMGRLMVDTTRGARVVHAPLPVKAGVLYWTESCEGTVCTKVGYSDTGWVSVSVQEGLVSAYVFMLASRGFSGTRQHPVKVTGLGPASEAWVCLGDDNVVYCRSRETWMVLPRVDSAGECCDECTNVSVG